MRDDRSRMLILGLGRSGKAAAELALAHGHDVTVLDEFGGERLQRDADHLVRRGADVRLEYVDCSPPCVPDMVILSPGIRSESPLGRLASRLSCRLLSELEFGYLHANSPILAVTGTNGKTTVTELLTHCLRRGGYRVLAAGNIGTPLCEVVRRNPSCDFIVTEVSSFQLEHVDRFQPLAAAILNITPDHLDRHGTITAYRSAKARLFARIASPDRLVLRHDLSGLPELQAGTTFDLSGCRTFSLDPEVPAMYGMDRLGHLIRRDRPGESLFDTRRMKLVGKHNIENVLAVIALAEAAGIPGTTVAEHVSSFSPDRHRFEIVANHDGVMYVNDSKATNPDAMVQGILTAAGASPSRRNILLIAGGLDKGVDFSSTLKVLENHVKEAFLIGSCRERLANQWQDVVSCRMFGSLALAFDVARECAHRGDVVLLSPGCASQDMFTDYAHRGEEFCRLVKRSVGE